MANHTVSIFIRFKKGGKLEKVAAAYSGKVRLKPGFGKQNAQKFSCRARVYWLCGYDGPKHVRKRIGFDPSDTLKTQMRQEVLLATSAIAGCGLRNHLPARPAP